MKTNYFLKGRFLLNSRHPKQSNRYFVHKQSFTQSTGLGPGILSPLSRIQRRLIGPLRQEHLLPSNQYLSKAVFSWRSSFSVLWRANQHGRNLSRSIKWTPIQPICLNRCFVNFRLAEARRNHFEGKRFAIMYCKPFLSWSYFLVVVEIVVQVRYSGP